MEALSQPSRNNLAFPKINLRKFNAYISPVDSPRKKRLTQEEIDEVNQLDQWSNCLPTAKRKRNQTSESLAFLYKKNSRIQSRILDKSNINEYELSSISMALAQIDSELAKIRKINYEAIYQNIQYCKGIYENEFNALLKGLDRHHALVEDTLNERRAEIKSLREEHLLKVMVLSQIRNDKNSQNSGQNSPRLPYFKINNNSAKSTGVQLNRSSFMSEAQDLHATVAQIRDKIQKKEEELKSISAVLIRLEQARVKILKFSLQLGYDIRDEGIVWILKQLNKAQQRIKVRSIRNSQMGKENAQPPETRVKEQEMRTPKLSEFPIFLSDEEIDFIICKYKNDFKLKKIEQEKGQKAQEQKNILKEAYENVQRDKNRKLSMIKERQLAERITQERKTQRINGHKYLNHETLKLLQSSEQQIKATKYELIYKETLRKLNRLCVEEIYGKKTKSGQKKSMMRTDKIMEEVKKMLSDVTKLKEEEQQIKSEEQKYFSQILKKLRNQRYSGNAHRSSRNPISVIGCLVGWKKAKKILETELNISLASYY